MALIDVSEVFDPLFMSPVTLIQAVNNYDELGKLSTSDGEQVEIEAIVTSDQKTIALLPDNYRRVGTVIVRCLATDVPEWFKGSPNDRIEWRGKPFCILDSSSGEQFGRGFVKYICSPMGGDDGSY